MSMRRTTIDDPLTERVEPFLTDLQKLSSSDECMKNEVSVHVPKSNPSLKDLSMEVIRQNLKQLPSITDLDPALLQEIISSHIHGLVIPHDLPSSIAGQIECEDYWKKFAMDEFGDKALVEHGMSYKRMYFENDLSRLLEQKAPMNTDFEATGSHLATINDDEFISKIKSMADFIIHLKLRSVPDLQVVLGLLPNLMALNLQYRNQIRSQKRTRLSGRESIRDSPFHGMKIPDAQSLAGAVSSCKNLCSLALTNSLVDDDLVRVFFRELADPANCERKQGEYYCRPSPLSQTLIELDLSHNNISTEGLRQICNYFLPDPGKLQSDGVTQEVINDTGPSVLQVLKLAYNKIRAEGGRTLGRCLRNNGSIIHLDLRMNRLEDEGGELVFDGLRQNNCLKTLVLASNSLSSLSMTMLSKLVGFRSDDDGRSGNVLESIDLSSNLFTGEDIIHLSECLCSKHLASLDLRSNLDPAHQDLQRTNDRRLDIGSDLPCQETNVQDALSVIETKLVKKEIITC